MLKFSIIVPNDVILLEYEKYLDSYYRVVCVGEDFAKIYKEIKKYIKERIRKYERNRYEV